MLHLQKAHQRVFACLVIEMLVKQIANNAHGNVFNVIPSKQSTIAWNAEEIDLNFQIVSVQLELTIKIK